ncbi:PREDICTED: uncharacterized protein LOC106124194 isoform X2 [Papilio xuthus]|uniref:Uncharacterized protein LOC106124194 isoform X2 n=1 Tax=Papilio xuthus TaxID=66420 RepID=A0AAJ6ZN65_PAPXU|nr:PREDICTED: uncharacterized protein LOC106124194 isoform X2 [Papilio xuthus]
MRAYVYTLALLICCGISTARDGDNNEERNFITSVEDNMESKYEKFVFSAAQWLESINDRQLGSSALGRLLHYNHIKPKLQRPGTGHGAGAEEGRGLKKAAAGMMPLVFHVGAASTWMLVTSLLAAKSLALGLLLLVFKIAVSSAKVASFFTAMKGKQSEHHHDWSWSPHHHHDVAASHSGWTPHALDWATDTDYRTLPHEGHGEPPNAEASILHT